MRRIPLRLPAAKSVLVFCALAASMLFFNFALPQKEPLSFAVFYAALACGRNPFASAAAYAIASAAFLSLEGSLCCIAQAAFLLLVFALYARFRRRAGYERVAYAAVAQLPFMFLFPHAGYAVFPMPVLAQKAIIAAAIVLLSVLTECAMRAIFTRAFRCRLSGAEFAALGLSWLILGMGLYNALGGIAFTAVSVLALLGAAALVGRASIVPFAVVLSLPLCAVQVSAIPAAVYAAFGCVALLFAPYGRAASALAVFAVYLAEQWFAGTYAADALTIALSVLACALPAVLVCALPEKWLRSARHSLLFYRERALPRIAVNRSRRAVGEQLYEVAALFREIECAFLTDGGEDDSERRIREKLVSTLCKNCRGGKACRENGAQESFGRLVRVGMAKGKVNLIDLPAELARSCGNAAGLLFALNKELAEYSRFAAQMQAAREGRRLLAQQAHGVSEILKDIALAQSEAYAFSEEEGALARALQERGILSSEIFTYGEGDDYTVSMTLEERADAKAVCRTASETLGVPLALAEKIPLTTERACFVFRRKPKFDAAFGIAARPKQGELQSGDTHSILRIDERRFLVALSDGMGSGEQARDVSARTLSLLESFYKAKMPSETVLSTVNSLIAFSADETFSCLDLAAVNLDTGYADVVKIGSPAGFLISGDELKILEGESLPIGMLEAVHPATMRVALKEDDFLVFMSDGITAAFGSSADLCAYLSELRPLNPQALAENILQNALSRAEGSDDDMTVLAVKLTAAA